MLFKFIKAVRGLILMIYFSRIINPSKLLRKKKVVIIGAAASAFQKENGTYIDSLDFIIRLNKSFHTWNRHNIKYLGSKTNMLIHNFYENTDSGGGGPLDFDLFNKHEVQYVVQPRNNREGWHMVFNFYKKYLSRARVYVFPRSIYRTIDNCFKPLKPTMGFCALYTVLNSQCSEVFITGFTFFKKPYAKGYRDQLLDLNANENYIKEQGQHDPDLEYRLFKQLLLEQDRTLISVDQELYEILKADNYEGIQRLGIK